METLARIVEIRHQIAAWRAAGQRIAFVPTMGNLHDGHLHLMQRGREVADRVVASIFVNPAQFGPKEDFTTYPRTIDEDSAKLEAVGIDALFLPPVHEIYPHGHQHGTRVIVPELSDILCGAFRPGHFEGVTTVVARLFNIVQPDVALFGEKDFQQLLVIRSMVDDLALPVEIIGVPTVRESDGLAMSSRNQYLDDIERGKAPLLYQQLQAVAEALHEGAGDTAVLERDAMRHLEDAGFRPDYVSIREADTLAPPGPGSERLVVLAAAWLGSARLIDNLRIDR